MGLKISHELDFEIDKDMLDDVFDDPETRYVLLYMYLVRSNVYRNLEDDDLNEAFQSLYTIKDNDTIYVENLKILPEEIIEEMFAYGLILNIKNFNIFKAKPRDDEVRFDDGVFIEGENLLFSPEVLLRIIKPNFPVITLKKIVNVLNRMRSMMCMVSNATHPLVHKYNEDFALDEELFNLIFLLGNPYLALRLEKLIVSVEIKSKELENQLDSFLKVFYNEATKGKFLTKLKTAIEKSKDKDFFNYIIVKSKILPKKFNPKKKSDLYKEWRKNFSSFLKLKYDFIEIYKNIDVIKSLFSGKNQKMSYLDFIEEVSNNEEEISQNIRKSLLKIRSKLKEVNDMTSSTSIKDFKLLNLDLEREIIENEDEDEE